MNDQQPGARGISQPLLNRAIASLFEPFGRRASAAAAATTVHVYVIHSRTASSLLCAAAFLRARIIAPWERPSLTCSRRRSQASVAARSRQPASGASLPSAASLISMGAREMRSTISFTCRTSGAAFAEQRAAEQQDRRIDDGPDVGCGDAEQRRRFIDRLTGAQRAGLRRREQPGQPRLGISLRGLGPSCGQCMQAGQRFQAAVRGERYVDVLGRHAHDSNFPRHEMVPSMKFPINEHRGADARSDKQERAGFVTARRAFPVFTEQREVHIVLDESGRAERLLQAVPHPHRRPACQVRRENDDAPVEIDNAGRTGAQP